MRRLSRVLAIAVVLGLVTPAFAAGTPFDSDALGFHLRDQNGHWHSPAEFPGRWLVLDFYPKEFTPGCTTEVCTFRDDIAKLRQAGADVVGASLDDVKSHAEFAAKYHVPFQLLSDADRTVATEYGVPVSSMGAHCAKRTTFLIDPQGKIAKIYRDVDPEKNSVQVLGDLGALKAAS